MATENKQRILLVEDEENLRDAIKMNLEIEGYEVEVADSGFKALKKIEDQRFNLFILDIMLPELDGLTICQRIRLSDQHTPVLFLTAKDTGQDKINGLKAGADDYLTKPFNLEELLLRVKVLIKHSQRGNAVAESEMNQYEFSGNTVNFITYKVVNHRGEKFNLTKREAMLLKLLIARQGDVVSRQDILKAIWGYDVYPSTRTIDNFIMTFRKHFEKDPSNPKHFHSVRGVGYQFVA
ncbi:MAG: response regulator transcription factor [Chitinophagales bacterium]|nr:response regulator transcription factor [Chitinophagales bacterium]